MTAINSDTPYFGASKQLYMRYTYNKQYMIDKHIKYFDSVL